MKRIWFLLAIIFSLVAGRQVTNAQEFYYENGITEWQTTSEHNTDLAKLMKTYNISNWNTDNKDSILYKIRDFFKLNKEVDAKEPATAYIQMLINMALGLVSFISLILIIFAFYLILFDKGEDGVKKAKAVIKWVAIAIVLMWLSWLIVSFLFWFIFSGNEQTII